MPATQSNEQLLFWGARGSFMEEETFEMILKKVNVSIFKDQTKFFDFFFFTKISYSLPKVKE